MGWQRKRVRGTERSGDVVPAKEVWYVGRRQTIKSCKNKQEELKKDSVLRAHWEPMQGSQDGSDAGSFLVPASSRAAVRHGWCLYMIVTTYGKAKWCKIMISLRGNLQMFVEGKIKHGNTDFQSYGLMEFTWALLAQVTGSILGMLCFNGSQHL